MVLTVGTNLAAHRTVDDSCETPIAQPTRRVLPKLTATKQAPPSRQALPKLAATKQAPPSRQALPKPTATKQAPPSRQALPETTAIKQSEPAWRELLSSLDQLRSFKERSGRDFDTRFANTVEDISTRADRLANDPAIGDALQKRAREAKLCTLTLAAVRTPERYAQLRDSYGRTAFGADFARRPLVQESVQQIVMCCLGPKQSDDEAVLSLMLHARTYPDCPSNVALYATLVDRLVARGRGPIAAALAREGLDTCRGHANLDILQRRLERIQEDE
jgi:hypothetical protein